MPRTQVRLGVFETNSSSTHSISIGTMEPNDIPNVEGNEINIHFGEYGWEWQTFSNVEDRMSYAATFAFNYGTDADIDLFSKVVLKATGARRINYKDYSDDKWYRRGHIDHQSDDIAKEAFVSEEMLKQFLFAPDSEFATGNDNSDGPWDY